MKQKSTTTNISIRMDTEIKKEAEQLFAELGFNMTTAFNIFVRQSLRDHALPFKPQLDVPNAETIAAMEEVQQMIKNPSLGKSYTDVDLMMKELLD